MDPLTHTLVGFTVCKAGVGRYTKNWPWVMFFAGSAPDIDAIPFVSGDPNILNWHRHFMHSYAFAPVLALVMVIGVKYVLRRDVDFKGAYIVSLFGIIAHILVDTLTYRGARIFWPFTDEHIGLKVQSFMDPVLYLILGLGLCVPLFSNLVSGEIGAKRATGQVSAIIALLASCLWFGARHEFQLTALAEMNSRVYMGEAPKRVDAVPQWNPAEFVGLVEGEKFFKVFDVNLLEYFDPEGGETIYKQVYNPESSMAVRTAGAAWGGSIFMAWARWPRPIVTRVDGDTRWVVVIEDLVAEKVRSRAKITIKLDEKYKVQSEVYARSKSASGI